MKGIFKKFKENVHYLIIPFFMRYLNPLVYIFISSESLYDSRLVLMHVYKMSLLMTKVLK